MKTHVCTLASPFNELAADYRALLITCMALEYRALFMSGT